jgi:hypothetical protein
VRLRVAATSLPASSLIRFICLLRLRGRIERPVFNAATIYNSKVFNMSFGFAIQAVSELISDRNGALPPDCKPIMNRIVSELLRGSLMRRRWSSGT